MRINRRIVNDHKEEPPALKKGSGMPMTGNKPIVIPILMAI